MAVILRMERVEKHFGKKPVLRGIDLTLAEGESAAVKGRNGSGKSTLLRLAAGIDTPSAGSLESGLPSRQVGYVPDRFPPLRFTLNEYLTAMGRIRGMEPGRLSRRIVELADFAGLTADAERPIFHYSKGMLQKTAVLQAMLDEPRLLIMDEPMSGLDRASRSELLEMLKRLHAAGLTLLFSTHEDRSVSELTDRCYHLADGRLERLDSVLADGQETEPVVIEAEGLASEMLDSLLAQWPATNPTIRQARSEDAGIRLVTDRAHSDRLLLELLQRGAAIRSVRSDSTGGRAKKGGDASC